MTTISLIVAYARNRVIGRDGGMPWHLPADLRHFKKTTLGKPVIMGRKTFESIGKPLPGRANIVVTRDETWSAQGVTVVRCFADACAAAGEAEEIMVIGGGQLYAETLPKAQRVYVTEIMGDVDGDTWFPELDPSEWREFSRVSRPQDGPNPWDLNFIIYERR